MKDKLEDFIYDVLDLIINNKWAFAALFLLIMTFIAYFVLYPINSQLAIGFEGAAIITTIYRFSKPNKHE
jgi:hypothetical protein